MITVVFSIDLRHVELGSMCSPEEGRAFQAIQESIGSVRQPGSTLQGRSEVALVLTLPDNEKTFGDMIYWCNYAKISYKTLWLNDVAEWRGGIER